MLAKWRREHLVAVVLHRSVERVAHVKIFQVQNLLKD